MIISPFLAVGGLAVVVVIAAALWDEKKPRGRLHVRPRALLTPMEHQLYVRLRAARPELTVFCKVALSALVTTTTRERVRLRHRLADFVLVDAEFHVVAVVELDEGEQLERHVVGETVKSLLSAAGFVVVELMGLPEADALEAALPSTKGVQTPARAPSKDAIT